MNKYIKVFGMLALLTVISIFVILQQSVQNTKDTKIITSFYPLYITTLNIVDGKDDILIKNLNEEKAGCIHDIQITPQDMRLLSDAKIFIVNSEEIEPYVTDVTKQYKELNLIESCENIDVTHNPHVWMNLNDYKIQVKTIEMHLSQLDKKNKELYKKNADNYSKKIDNLLKKEKDIKENLQNLNIGILHEAFEYFLEDYNINIVFSIDTHEEEHESAFDMKEIIDKINKYDIKIVFADEEHGEEMASIIERETKCKVYFLNPIISGDYTKDGYLKAMEENLRILAKFKHE